MNKNPYIRRDLLLIAILLMISLILIIIFFCKPSGDYVSITISGQHYADVPLNENREIDLQTGDHNEYFNVLIIQDGKAYIKSANCPDGLCAKHRPIFREGESIICLPHKIVITISKNMQQEIDIVA